MRLSQAFRRGIAFFLLLSTTSLSLFLPVAQAGMVGTGQVLSNAQAQTDRARLNALLQRDELAVQLQAAGVDPAQVQARVAALSDQEVATVVDQLDQLPAGGDIIGLAVFIFLVLLATDIMGYTDIFPFVKKTVK